MGGSLQSSQARGAMHMEAYTFYAQRCAFVAGPPRERLDCAILVR
jgi:hypothetical protein